VGESSFWYRPTRVVPDQRPLNGRCCKRSLYVTAFITIPSSHLTAILSADAVFAGHHHKACFLDTCLQSDKHKQFVMSISLCLCVCLSEIISSELQVQSSPNFLCMLAMAVAQSSCGDIVIRYVFPVLWTTSYLLIRQGCSTLPPS